MESVLEAEIAMLDCLDTICWHFLSIMHINYAPFHALRSAFLPDSNLTRLRAIPHAPIVEQESFRRQ